MQLIIFLIGLAGVIIPEQFSGQDTLGWAFIVVAAVITLVQVIFYLVAARKVNGMTKDLRRGHDDFFRRF